MQSFLSDDFGPEEAQIKKAKIYDRQTTANEILDLVKTEGLSFLEACSWWLEERSIPETQFSKYIPEDILDLLQREVIEDSVLKPSLTKQNTKSNLDFMYG